MPRGGRDGARARSALEERAEPGDQLLRGIDASHVAEDLPATGPAIGVDRVKDRDLAGHEAASAELVLPVIDVELDDVCALERLAHASVFHERREVAAGL